MSSQHLIGYTQLVSMQLRQKSGRRVAEICCLYQQLNATPPPPPHNVPSSGHVCSIDHAECGPVERAIPNQSTLMIIPPVDKCSNCLIPMVSQGPHQTGRVAPTYTRSVLMVRLQCQIIAQLVLQFSRVSRVSRVCQDTTDSVAGS